MGIVRKWADAFSAVGERIGVLGIMVMVAVNCIDVLGAKLFTAPIPGATEIISLVQVATIAFAIAATQRLGGHISVEMFVQKMGRRTAAMLKVLTSGLGVFLFLVVIWESYFMGVEYWSSKEVSATVLIPFYPFAFAFALAMVPVMVMLLCDMIDAVREVIS